MFTPQKLGKISNFTQIFQVGWNHQLESDWKYKQNIWISWIILILQGRSLFPLQGTFEVDDFPEIPVWWDMLCNNS